MLSTIVLITGGNTGLGYASAEALLGGSKAYTILITSRTLDKAKGSAEKLNAAARGGSKVVPLQLNLDHDDSIAALAKEVEETYGQLDILINNAGIQFDPELAAGKVTARQAFNWAFNTNVTSTHILTEALVPLLLKSSAPRILFISSGIGSLGDHDDQNIPINKSGPAGWPKPYVFNVTTYRTSKTGMNMMILEWIRVLKNDNVVIHIVDPGLLATDLGGHGPEQLRKIGAEEPSVGGHFVKSIAEGEHDGNAGKMISRQGVVPW